MTLLPYSNQPYSHSDSHDAWHVKYRNSLLKSFLNSSSSLWLFEFPQPNIMMVSSQADIMCFPSNQPYFHLALQATSHTFIWLCILSFGLACIHIENVLNFSASSEWLFEFPQPKIIMVSSQANIVCFPGNQPHFIRGLYVV